MRTSQILEKWELDRRDRSDLESESFLPLRVSMIKGLEKSRPFSLSAKNIGWLSTGVLGLRRPAELTLRMPVSMDSRFRQSKPHCSLCLT